MSEETDAIRQDIATVRDAMTDKIEQIETKVRGTVDTTVEQVGRLFDVEQQVRERPWVALGIAAAVGYAAGSMGGSGGSSDTQYARHNSAFSQGNGSVGYQSSGQHAANQSDQSNDMMAELGDRFGNELRLITSAALAAGVNLLRDTIKQSVPQFDQEYEKIREPGSTTRHAAEPFQEDRESIRSTTAVDPNIPLRNYERSQSPS